MAKRSQTYIKLPWTGGVNDSVDPGLLPDNDLVQADNVTLGVSGSRLKREGISYFDQLTVPSASSVTRSSTTVTITFSENVITATNKKFVVGERLAIVCADSEFSNATATVTAIPGNNQIQYTVSIAPTAASTTLTSITRLASIVGIHDFWYYDASGNTKAQYVLAVNSDAQVFRYTVNGERVQLSNTTASVTGTAATDRITWAAHNKQVGDALSFDSLTPSSGTGLTINTTYYVASVVDANNITLTASRQQAGPIDITANITDATISHPLYTTSINSAAFLSMNEKCVITFDGIGNHPKVFDPVTSTTTIRGLNGAAPNAKIICEAMHYGRAWMNDKEDNERLHYSSSYNFDEWNGYGDSGVLNVGFGDGDPDGINAIHPPFKQTLFCTKRNNIYRIDGSTPDDFTILQLSTGIGGVGHTAVAAIDLDDVAYMSYKGIHSLSATNSFGAFQGGFLSEKIQNAFSEWTPGRLKYTSAKYIPTLNSVFFSVASADFDDDNQDSLWIFNIKFKEWHRWPNIQAKSLGRFDDSGKAKLLLGRYDGRIAEAQNGDFTDYSDTAIQYTIKTGTIYPDGNPNSIKMFKKLGFLFRPKGDFSFTATVKIDNYPAQSLSFAQIAGGAALGVDFILGVSTLASSNVLAPTMLPIDGIGRGITIKIENNASEQQIELYGAMIEWESAADSQETVVTQDL